MSATEGGAKNVLPKEVQVEALKVYFLYGTVVFTIQGLFVFLYLKMTPFAYWSYGFFGYIFAVIASGGCIFLLDKIGNKYDWYVFSRLEYFNSWKCGNSYIKKSTEGWQIFTNFIFIAVWITVIFYAPKNLYDAVFEPNVLSWLDQGKCEEIKKYESETASFCSDVMSQARKNIAGIFVVQNKNLSANAMGCTYSLSSVENGMIILTTNQQSCDFVKDQKVVIFLHSFIGQKIAGGADRYGYLLQIKEVPK